MSYNIETIAAVATPPGRGGIGIVRISGPAAAGIARAVCRRLPAPRQTMRAQFLDAAGGVIDDGLALYFPAPNSFTGEDVLELHGHGGAVIMDLLLARIVGLGARLARPGEFSERAFLNGKLDLVQAEAIADLIEAGSEQAARAALRSLQGEFSRTVRALVEALIELRAYVEAAIDFPEEEVDFLADNAVAEKLTGIQCQFNRLRAKAKQGSLIRDGLTVAIAGRPNAGKSSLLNRLAGVDAAIITPIPGTTRDVLKERISLDGLPLNIVDTAGLRAAGDLIEEEGIRRTWSQIEKANHVLLIVDDTLDVAADDRAALDKLPASVTVTLVHNKIDLSGRKPGIEEHEWLSEVALSAKTGAGFDALRNHLKTVAGFQQPGADTITSRRRHLDAVERAGSFIEAATEKLAESAGELMAEDLSLAQHALGEITGEVTSDDLLGRIFSSFCIGK
jgi:tRNA modification GTPase